MNIGGVEFDEIVISRDFGSKTPCVYVKKGNVYHPMVYLKKAKGCPDDFFTILLKRLSVKVLKEELKTE